MKAKKIFVFFYYKTYFVIVVHRMKEKKNEQKLNYKANYGTVNSLKSECRM